MCEYIGLYIHIHVSYNTWFTSFYAADVNIDSTIILKIPTLFCIPYQTTSHENKRYWNLQWTFYWYKLVSNSATQHCAMLTNFVFSHIKAGHINIIDPTSYRKDTYQLQDHRWSCVGRPPWSPSTRLTPHCPELRDCDRVSPSPHHHGDWCSHLYHVIVSLPARYQRHLSHHK